MSNARLRRTDGSVVEVQPPEAHRGDESEDRRGQFGSVHEGRRGARARRDEGLADIADRVITALARLREA